MNSKSSSLVAIFRPAAREEFNRAVDWYAERSSAVAERFIGAMSRTLNHIEQRPELYAKAHKNIREALVQGFPYCIYYEVEAASIDVIAVFHTSRNPEIWQRRT